MYIDDQLDAIHDFCDVHMYLARWTLLNEILKSLYRCMDDLGIDETLGWLTALFPVKSKLDEYPIFLRAAKKKFKNLEELQPGLFSGF